MAFPRPPSVPPLLVLNAKTTEPIITQSQTNYILSVPAIPITEFVAEALSPKLRRSYRIRK